MTGERLKSQLIILLTVLLFSVSCGFLSKDGKKRKAPKELTTVEQYEVLALFIEANKEKITGNFRNAKALFAECIRRDPTNHAALYELASLMAMDKEYNDAIVLGEEALKLDPDNEWYYLLLSELYEATKQYKKGYRVLERLVEKFPGNTAYYFELATAYLYAGEYKKAINVYDKIESIIGITEDLSVQKHSIYLYLNDERRAIAEVAKLIEAFPQETEYLLLLADVYSRTDKEDKALEIYEKVLELEPDNTLVHLSLADYYRNMNKLEKSFSHLEKAFSNPSMHVETKVNILVNFYQLTEYSLNKDYKEQAFKLLDILIDVHPEEAIAYSIYGDYLNREEAYEESREMFYKVLELGENKYLIWEQLLRVEFFLENYETLDSLCDVAMELFPEQPMVYLFSGYANFTLENYEKAAQVFKDGLIYTLFDENLREEFYIYLGESYNKLKNFAESDAAFESALKINPKNAYVLNNYSYYLALREERLEEAKKMSLKSNILKPKTASFLDTYGWIMYKMEDFEEALKWLEKALENNGSERAVIVEHYGDVLYQLDKKEKALKQWKKAQSIGEGSEFLDEKIKQQTLIE